jgi:hypothetical protein
MTESGHAASFGTDIIIMASAGGVELAVGAAAVERHDGVCAEAGARQPFDHFGELPSRQCGAPLAFAGMSDHAIALAGLIAGAVGALAAVIALIYAHRAHRESVEANDIADEASKLARNANDIAARGEVRETEPHDVFWEGDWDPLQPGRYSLRKRGDATAINVRARVSYSGDEQMASSECMSTDGATLTFRFDRALRDYQREYSQRDNAANSPFPDVSGSAVLPRLVEERVEWLTPQGTPKLHRNTSFTTFSMYFRS